LYDFYYKDEDLFINEYLKLLPEVNKDN